MVYIDIINNSEKYIEMLKQTDKVYINGNDIKPSTELMNRYDPLWGYYDVKTFMMNGIPIKSNDFFSKYIVICGDFYLGEGYLRKIPIKDVDE